MMVRDPVAPSQSKPGPHAVGQYLIEGLAYEYATLPKLLRELHRRNEGKEQCHHLLAENVRKMHQRLRSHGQFKAAIEAASACSPSVHHPWRFHLLGQSPLIRIGLLTIFKSSSIPLHDHPDSFGAQCVLAGEIRVRQYDQPGGLDERQKHVLTLSQPRDEVLGIGGFSTYLRDNRNIHELASIASRSVVLSLKIHPLQERERYWYCLAEGYSKSTDQVYTRVKQRSRP